MLISAFHYIVIPVGLPDTKHFPVYLNLDFLLLVDLMRQLPEARANLAILRERMLAEPSRTRLDKWLMNNLDFFYVHKQTESNYAKLLQTCPGSW